MKSKLHALPNYLTLSRIAAIPLLTISLFMANPVGNWCASAVFIAACVTDFFDGYIAREWQATSEIGKFLDPVADKLLVASTVLLLAGLQKIYGLHLIAALIILCREILVSGLREFVANTDTKLPVTVIAKWKTGIQMFALTSLIVANSFDINNIIYTVGLVGLWIAAIMTVISCIDYIQSGWRYIKYADLQK